MGKRRPLSGSRAHAPCWLLLWGCCSLLGRSLLQRPALLGAPSARGSRRRSRGRPGAAADRGRALPRAASGEALPASPSQLLAERRARRWDLFRDSLDWTRYHLDVVFVEHGGTGGSRRAAGLFERVARFHGCAGALPAVIGTTGCPSPELDPEEARRLEIGPQWLDADAEPYDAPSLRHYDAVVCVDAGAAEFFRAALGELGEDAYPANVVELSDFGAYLELRRPESPMKAWVPDYRAVLDPGYDDRQAGAVAPMDDALAVWKELPEDLAQMIQPHYEGITSYTSLGGGEGDASRAGYDDALLAFHVGGLVRFLMDTYPLDLRGGPGYCGPP